MSDLLEKLTAKLGERVRSDAATRAAHRRDAWVLSELWELEGRLPAPPLAVVEAASTEDVAVALRLCREARAPVVTYGGGSGVCGGVLSSKAAVVISTRGLAGLRHLDRDGLVASFGAGTNGMEAERLLEKEGLTLGHWPQSIEISTVGGWVATRAAGQFSTGYGAIEDMLLDLEVVLPDGRVLRTRRTPRASAGPDLRQLFLGSEGTLGVITEVGFSLRALPEARRGQAFHFETIHAGFDPIRRILRAGWRPPVVRLYDLPESKRHFPETCPDARAMLILLHEGPAAWVEVQAKAAAEICAEAGGAEADPASVDHWLEQRNRVPGFRGFLEKGIILDTIEVACTWGRVGELYERVTRSLSEVPGALAATAHSSHSYRSGTNLYFTCAARPEDRGQMASTYGECWRRTMQAALAVGAGISHHHGIGRVRSPYLVGEIGEAGVATLRAIKRALDPDGLLNPGVLLPSD